MPADACDACKETKWYDKAARQGHPQAQYLLAFSYLRGRGVFEDDAKAYRWALAASRNGVAKATEDLAYFSKDLSAAERQAIDREMAAWRPEDEPPAWIIRIPDLPFFSNPLFGPEPCYDLF